jgi:hypothetical protein
MKATKVKSYRVERANEREIVGGGVKKFGILMRIKRKVSYLRLHFLLVAGREGEHSETFM